MSIPKKTTKTENNTTKRPPVVVVMGHIDHGKSSLLDYIRKTKIVEREAGGITQHIGAYQVEHISSDNKKNLITFLDTPGHEAFWAIRKRGTAVADIAILAVSAEDGVKPQTIEAFKSIKDAGIPFLVAITKIDKINADIEKTKQSLGENEIYVEGWGGDTPFVLISSVTGQGIPELLDMLILMTELADIKTDPSAPATGMIIESELDPRSGIIATILIKNGTLHTETFLVAGRAYTPVRYIEDFQGKKISSASASMPVKITGWNIVPECSLDFVVAENKKSAEALANQYKETSPQKIIDTTNHDRDTVENRYDGVVVLPLILKADTTGSLQGITHELEKIKHDKVRIKIVSINIGDINEKDVKQAVGNPNIVIIGFNIKPDKKAVAIIERSTVSVQSFSIIYDLVKFVRQVFEQKIPKEYKEESTGILKIVVIFSKEKDRQIVGGKVETGTISTGSETRFMRRNVEIGRGKIRELQEKKSRVDEVAEGHECGAMIESKIELAPGDRIEAIRTVEIIKND